MPLRVSCPGPLLCLACLGGGGPVPVPPYLAWGPAPSARRVRGGGPPPLRGASGVRRCPSPGRPRSGRAVGVRHPHAVGAVVRLWGPGTVPSACMPFGSCVPRGWWGAAPGEGVACHRCEGPSPSRPPSGAGSRGSATRVSQVRSVVGVGTQHRPHSVRPCGPALLAVGLAEGRPRGGAFHCCGGRLMSGAPPPPTARPLGGLLGSTTHVLWARACGCGGPKLTPWPACPVGAACRGVGGGPSPGGVASRCCEGRLVSAAVPAPAARPLGRATGFPRPVCSGCGQCGRGDPAAVPQRAPLRAGVARCGGGGRFEVRGLILRVLDAFRPQGATWSGQMISSPPVRSGVPSKRHILPSGGVPRFHRAQSPVPPRLPGFADPRSVHQFAAVAAGAYPACHPHNAWSPGRQRRQARATGLSPVGPPWAGAEVA